MTIKQLKETQVKALLNKALIFWVLIILICYSCLESYNLGSAKEMVYNQTTLLGIMLFLCAVPFFFITVRANPLDKSYVLKVTAAERMYQMIGLSWLILIGFILKGGDIEVELFSIPVVSFVAFLYEAFLLVNNILLYKGGNGNE